MKNRKKKKISGKELARREAQRNGGNYLMTNNGAVLATPIKGGYRLEGL